MELPKLDRNSVCNISSILGKLSMHPAINAFMDDSSVKFYLNQKRKESQVGTGTKNQLR